MDSVTQEKSLPKSERYIQYREQLLKSGFSEAVKKSGHFYLQATGLTAFIINLEDEEYGITVLYGFASTAYMTGDEHWLSDYGSENDTCPLRNILFIYDESSGIRARETVSSFYRQYKSFSKDEILALKKERQKAFLDRFARALKPLGFKRKGTEWTRDQGNGTILSFEAQKSAFSDQYYFNVVIHDPTDRSAWQNYKRVEFAGKSIHNWQLMTDEQIENLIQYTLTNYIVPKIQ